MLTAPYNNAMRLGQGFNTYTHEICVNDAVIIDPDNPGGDAYGGDEGTVSQIVSYCTRHVDKLSDVTSAMNISAAGSIKSPTAGGSLSGSYVDSDKFKESAINFFCQVKVINQVIMAKDLLKFNDIPGMPHSELPKVFGDSFISGFMEGGELNALISVKSTDQSSITDIKAALEASFGKGGAGMSGDIEAKFGLNKESHISSTETTITVNWNGGGIIKPKDELWSIESLVKAAAAFPENVRHTPQRTQAILTKYENLRSYHMITPPLPAPLNYQLADLYTNDLLDAFMDYKHIWKQIHTMSTALEFDEIWLQRNQDRSLEPAPERQTGAMIRPDQLLAVANASVGYMEAGSGASLTHDDRVKDIMTRLTRTSTGQTHSRRAYEPTLDGLERARYDCRVEMGKILNEVAAVELDPTTAATADPNTKFLNPAIFRKLLPETTQRTRRGGAPRVPFYDSSVDLPFSIQAWQKGLSPEDTRDLTMTACGGETDISVDAGVFAQNAISDPKGSEGKRTAIPAAAQIDSIQAWVGTDCLRGIQVTYQGKSAPDFKLGDCTGTAGPLCKINPGDRIVALNVSSAKVDGVRCVYGFRVATEGLVTHDLGMTTPNDKMREATTQNTRIQYSGWSLKGFWAQSSSKGIIRLGGFYGKGVDTK